MAASQLDFSEVIGIIHAVEPSLTPESVSAALCEVVTTAAQYRRLRHALTTNPALLTCGAPEGPKVVDLVIRRLLAVGVANLVAPRCPMCGQPNELESRFNDQRICGACETKRRQADMTCPSCGNKRHLSYLNRAGQLVCAPCRPKPAGDPVELVCVQLRRILDDVGVPDDQLQDAVRRVDRQPHGLLKLSWELEDHPARLTGDGAAGSPKLMRLLVNLRDMGARRVVVPPCPRCGRDVPLICVVDGQRACKRCHRKAGPEKSCASCGNLGEPAGRTTSGELLCHEVHPRQWTPS